jgi:FixJ family two-component response regulator
MGLTRFSRRPLRFPASLTGVSAASILVVEDDMAVGKVVCAMLERAGFDAALVGSAHEMLERLGRDDFDMLLSDIHLPDDIDLGFLGKLADRPGPQIPVVLITGAPSIETAVKALRHGVVDYLRKPIQSEDLVASAHRAVSWARAMESVELAQRSAESWLRSLQAAGEVLRRGPLPDMPAVARPNSKLLISQLSTREREIVEHLSRGNRVPEIALELGISPNTVRNHLKSVFRKLGVSSQVELLSLLAGGSN